MALTIIERNVQLDLYDHDLTPSKIKAIALDSNTRYVGAEIHNGGQTYDVGQNTGVTLTIIRPDKTGVQITGETFQYTVGEGETVYGAYAELTQTALAISGTLLAQFMLTSGDQILRTEVFTINNGVALDATVSEWAGEYQGYNLDELVQNVNESSAKVDAMEQDVSELKSGFNDLYNTAYVTDSANGSIAHFEDGADNVPMKSVKVNIEPAQSGSGDPSPSNVRPISGWGSIKVTRAGKNVFPSKGLTQTLNGITIHSNDDGSFTVNGTATANAQFDLTLNNELKLQSGQYTVGMFADKAVTFNNQNVWWFFYSMDARADIVNCQSPSKTFTLSTITSTRFYLMIISGATVDNVTLYPILVYGSDAPTEFEPYNGNTYDISLASAGTVYGGTLDPLTGVLTVDTRLLTLSSDGIGNYSFNSANGQLRITGLLSMPNTLENICSHYKSFSGSFANLPDKCFMASSSTIAIKDSDYTSLASWKSYLDAQLSANTPVQVCVILQAEEVKTIQLTPNQVNSLLGVNNIWADSGDTEVVYRADTKLYIQKKIAEALASLT